MDRRTSLITAAAVAGVLFVGSGAIAANIGVLNSTEDDSIGNLSSEVALEVPTSTIETQVIDVYVEDPTLAPTTVAENSDSTTQEYAVEGAGVVIVEQTEMGLFVNGVQANDGWTWTARQSAVDEVDVTFTSGDTTYLFHAEAGPDGLVAARVEQPITDVGAGPAPTSANGSNNSDDRYDDDDDHDDEHDDDDEHEDAYEGSDDDD